MALGGGRDAGVIMIDGNFSPLVRDFGEGLRPCGEGERRRVRRRFCFHLIVH